MKTSVKYNELNELSNFIISKKEEIDLLFQEMIEIIDSVDNAWQGTDCKEFIKGATSKLEIEKKNNNSLKVFADDLKIVADNYMNFDNKWAEEAKRES